MSQSQVMLDHALRLIQRDLQKIGTELAEKHVSDDSRKALDRYARTLLAATKQHSQEEAEARELYKDLTDEQLAEKIKELRGKQFENE